MVRHLLNQSLSKVASSLLLIYSLDAIPAFTQTPRYVDFIQYDKLEILKMCGKLCDFDTSGQGTSHRYGSHATMDAAGDLLAMLVSYADGIRAEKWTHGYLTFTKPAKGKRQHFKHTMLEQAD